MRGTFWKLLKVMVFKWNLINKEIDRLGISDFLKFDKNLVWTKTARPSPWLQSHKSVTAKSQKGWCQCNKVINYSTRMIVVSIEPTEPMGKSLSEVCQSQNSVWPLKRVVFKSMWLHVTKKGFSLWGLINRGGTPPGILITILVLPGHFSCVWLFNP